MFSQPSSCFKGNVYKKKYRMYSNNMYKPRPTFCIKKSLRQLIINFTSTLISRNFRTSNIFAKTKLFSNPLIRGQVILIHERKKYNKFRDTANLKYISKIRHAENSLLQIFPFPILIDKIHSMKSVRWFSTYFQWTFSDPLILL